MKKLSIKVRDLEPLKDVVGGRRRGHHLHAAAAGDRPIAQSRGDLDLLGEYSGGLDPFGLNRIP